MNFEVENLTNLAHCKKRSPFRQPSFTKVWTFCQGSASVPVRLNSAQSCGWFFFASLGGGIFDGIWGEKDKVCQSDSRQKFTHLVLVVPAMEAKGL